MTELLEWIWNDLDQDDELKIGKTSSELVEQVNSLGLPEKYTEYLLKSWPQESGYVGSFYLNSTQEILEGFSSTSMTKLGYLEIGSAGNGDPLVVDFRNKEIIGFINHETLNFDGNDTEADFEPISVDLISFLESLIKKEFLPSDYWIATDYNTYKLDELERFENYKKIVQQIHEKRKA